MNWQERIEQKLKRPSPDELKKSDKDEEKRRIIEGFEMQKIEAGYPSAIALLDEIGTSSMLEEVRQMVWRVGEVKGPILTIPRLDHERVNHRAQEKGYVQNGPQFEYERKNYLLKNLKTHPSPIKIKVWNRDRYLVEFLLEFSYQTVVESSSLSGSYNHGSQQFDGGWSTSYEKISRCEVLSVGAWPTEESGLFWHQTYGPHTYCLQSDVSSPETYRGMAKWTSRMYWVPRRGPSGQFSKELICDFIAENCAQRIKTKSLPLEVKARNDALINEHARLGHI